MTNEETSPTFQRKVDEILHECMQEISTAAKDYERDISASLSAVRNLLLPSGDASLSFDENTQSKNLRSDTFR